MMAPTGKRGLGLRVGLAGCLAFAPGCSEAITSPWVMFGALIVLGFAALLLRMSASEDRSRLIETGIRSRDILENMPVLMNAIGEDGLIVVWNKECERVTGYSAEEVIGNPKALEMLYPDPAYRAEVLAKGIELDYDYHNWERHYIAKDGTPKYLATSSISKRFPVPGWKAWGIAVDITQRRQAETARRKLEEQLRHSQKMEAVGELASGVAHDFRNLLTVISAHTDHVRHEVSDNKTVLASLDRVEEAVSQAAIVTRSLLTFSKKLDTVMVPMDLCAAIDDTTQMIVRTMPSSVEVTVEASCDPAPWVEADPTQIQQVLINLVLNARDAMPDGGKLGIQVRSDPADSGRVQLIVRDTGCGMTPEISSRAFEPFFTTKAEERGTGLGLATVHGIVENHDATIRIETEIGRGTAFLISFPLTDRRDGTVRAPRRRLRPAGSGEMILLAEQNHQVLQIVAATLKEFGYAVIKARDGQQLLRSFQLHRKQIRLLVLDVELPNRSGAEVLRELREQGETVPAVLISTNPRSVDDDLLDRNTVMLPKPFQMTELADEVHEFLIRDQTEAESNND